jgi:hypothetical protein
MHHAPNHVGFGISPELNVVHDGVHGSPEPYMVQGAIPALNRSGFRARALNLAWFRAHSAFRNP